MAAPVNTASTSTSPPTGEGDGLGEALGEGDALGEGVGLGDVL
jgi:hypothetical protein